MLQAPRRLPAVSGTVLVRHRPVRGISGTLLMPWSRIPSLNPKQRVRGCLGVERQEQFLGTPLAMIRGGVLAPVKPDTALCLAQ